MLCNVMLCNEIHSTVMYCNVRQRDVMLFL